MNVLSLTTHPRKLRLWLILGALILAGSALRFYDLGTQPYWMDEGYTINAILAISERGQSVLDSGLPYSCPLYCYPTAYLADTFGHTATNYRIPAAIMGVLFIGVIFAITRRLFDTRIALLTTTFVTFSYFHIAWSRQARWYTLFTVFFWLALYSFYRAYYFKEKRLLFSSLAGIFTTLTILTHGLGYALPFIMVGWIAVDQFLIKKHFDWKTLIKVGTAAVGVTLILYTFFNLSSFINFVKDFGLFYGLPYYLSFYLRTYWLFIPFVLIAVLFPPREYRKQILLLCVAFLAYLVPLSFLTSIIHYRYLFHVTPVIFILGTIGMVMCYQKIQGRFYKISFVTGITLLFFTVGGGVLIPQSLYQLETDNPAVARSFPGTAGYYAYTPQPNWNKAYAFIRDNRTEGDMIISSHSHFTKIFLQQPGYWLGYNYHGMSDLPTSIQNDREYYVGAVVIDNLDDFMHSTDGKSGYVIFDYMAADNRIADDTLTYIRRNLQPVYQDKTNEFSQIWVYRFEPNQN